MKRDWKYIMLRCLKAYCISVALTTICMICYIEVGSDKGWPRAESWHTCLHTHGHFDFLLIDNKKWGFIWTLQIADL